MGRHCCACSRKVGYGEMVFSFPLDPGRRKEWLDNAGLENVRRLSENQIRNRSLCSKHFSIESFANKDRVRLLRTAVPTIFSSVLNNCTLCRAGVRRVRNLTSRMTGIKSVPGNNNTGRNEKQADGTSDSSPTKVVALIGPTDVKPKDAIENFRHIEEDVKTPPRIDNDIYPKGHGASCSTDFTSIFIKQEEASICQSSLPSLIQLSNNYQPGSSSNLETGVVSMIRYPCEAKQQYLPDKNQSPASEVLSNTVEKVPQVLQAFEQNPFIGEDTQMSQRIYNEKSPEGFGSCCSTGFAGIFIKQEEDSVCQPSLPSTIHLSDEYQLETPINLVSGAVSMLHYTCDAEQTILSDKNKIHSSEIPTSITEKDHRQIPVISKDTQTSTRIDNGKSTERFGSSCSTGFAGIFIKQEEDFVCQSSLPSTIHLSDGYQHSSSTKLESGAVSMLHYSCDAEKQYLPDENPIHSSEIPTGIAEKDYQLLQPSEQIPILNKDIKTPEPFNNDSFLLENTKLQSPCLFNNHMKVRQSGYALKLSTEEDSIEQPERPSLPEIRPRLSLTNSGLEVISSKHFLNNLRGNISNNIKQTSEKESLSKNSSLDEYRDVHMKGKLYQCSICMKQFFLKSTMAKHMIRHKGENGYECRICNTAFTQMYKLTAHMVIHTGGKLYECEICKRKFTFRSSLNRHISIHNDEKPYNCDICMKTFSRKSSLTRHIRSHNGVKPY